MKNVKDKLLPFQIQHTENLIRNLKKNNSVLDASDTGTGKTYCAIAACKILEYKPIVICTKSTITFWERICKYFEVKPFFIVNYETLKLGKYYDSNRNRINCPYISIKYNSDDSKNKIYYEFNIDEPNIIFIFDEVHKCYNLSTENGKLLYSAKLTNYPIMILSATIADYPEKFRLFFWILNFIDPESVARDNIDFKKYMNIMTKWLIRDQKPMLRIYGMLYPNRASRMRIDSLGDLFPETQIIAEPYNIGKTREIEIEKQYSIIGQEMENLKKRAKTDKQNPLVNILRAHQKIEMIKVPIFVELANDFMENNYHVVIFVNFTQTLELLAKYLKTESVLHGQQSATEREEAIKNFNDNKTNIIICNIKMGTGISLHDIHGNAPRVSLISPTWSSIELIQALGRIHRAGGKSKSLQRIIYAANTVEEKIADKLRIKLKDLNTINNGDLDLTGISNAVHFKKKF